MPMRRDPVQDSGEHLMKIVVWTIDMMPGDLEFTDEGNWAFEDSAIGYNLHIGDQIQFRRPDGQGTFCYFVTDVCPVWNDFDGFPVKKNLVVMEE
jgi:hypothetical protein